MDERRPPVSPLSDTEPGQPAPDTLAPGQTIGRYQVRRVVGAGGMGIVYEAYDPKLDRRVALKLMRPGGSGTRDATRLIREAQAVARIRHRNVITLYDIGTVGHRPFVAMELIDGTTLAGWTRAARRSVAAVLAVYAAAGDGLRAAHQAGVVHRDFKPDNVLLDGDGRVYVTDFGLACSVSAAHPLGAAGGESTLFGTPAYMAPEQRRGDPVDTRADQFSFCVSLCESLYGTRPATVEDLAPLRRPGVPPSVKQALRRGLEQDPAARFASMDELLAVLAPRRRPRLVTAAATLALALIAVAAVGWPRVQAKSRVERCRRAGDKMNASWRARKPDLARLVTAERDAAAWAGAQETLDRYADEWTRLHEESCAAAPHDDGNSQALLDLRMECLNQRWQDADALLSVLTQQPHAVAHLREALGSLQPVAACRDVEVPRHAPPTPPPSPSLALVEQRIARARAEHAVEDCRRALDDASAAVTEAHALGALAEESEAHALVGLSKDCRGERESARASFIESAVTAARAEKHRLVVTAYLQLASNASDLANFDDADHWLTLAREEVQQHGADDKLRAQIEFIDCYAQLNRNRHAAAEPLCRKARALAARLPARSMLEADAAHGLGMALGAQGRFAEAAEAYRDAQRLLVRLRGPDSVDERRVWSSLAVDEAEQDHLATALSLQKRVLDRDCEGQPALCVLALDAYGEFLQLAGRSREALLVFERALGLAETLEPPHDVESGMARAGVGASLLALDRPREALAQLEQAWKQIPADGYEDQRAFAGIELAKAMWSVAARRPRALQLARQSRDWLRAHPLGALRVRQLAELEAWLRAREKPG